MRAMIILLALVLSCTASAQDVNTDSSWWESYNKSNERKSDKSKTPRSFFALKVQAGVNFDHLSGSAVKEFEGGTGFNTGISMDFWNNKWLGLETGLYYTMYNIGFGGDMKEYTATMNYLEFQVLANVRKILDDVVLELNLGFGFDLGLSAPVKRDNKKTADDLFVGPKNGTPPFKDGSTCLLYGLTFKFSDFYIRAMGHHGISNIINWGTNKGYIRNYEVSLGAIF